MPNWEQVINEIMSHQNALLAQGAMALQQSQQQATQAVGAIRKKYLQLLHAKTDRNIIAYYSGFLSKPDLAALDITDEDKNGFMMAVHGMERAKGLDLFLHTPGGSMSATVSIVDYLHKMFGKNIRAIVPQLAMSAGTMIACSCREIFMGTHSNLGPIDPQLRGLAAAGVIEEFKRAAREIKKDSKKISLWQPILNKYYPTFLGNCENALKWSTDFVREQLETVMFEGEADAKERAKAAVKALASYRGNRGHDRHLHYDDCEKMKLRVKRIEDDSEFQDLVLTIHHTYMHSLANTPTFKIIENQNGQGFSKQRPMEVAKT